MPGTSAAHLGQLNPQTGTFVGTGQWDGPDLPATVEQSRTEPLQRHEIQQAAYQLAARALGDPIEDPSDLAHLAAATETMHQTRTDLKHGRGNVAVDIRESGGDSTILSKVVYEMKKTHFYNTAAGVALAYGAGNCDTNSWINARRYAATLQEAETVSMRTTAACTILGRRSTGPARSWAMVHPRPGR